MTWWKNLSVKTKFISGIGLILLLTILNAAFATHALDKMTDDIGKLNAGTDLRRAVLEREVQHLQWVNNLSKYLISAEEKELSIVKDPTQCGFGKWYYGGEKDAVLKEFPELKGDIEALDDPELSAETLSHIEAKWQPIISFFLDSDLYTPDQDLGEEEIEVSAAEDEGEPVEAEEPPIEEPTEGAPENPEQPVAENPIPNPEEKEEEEVPGV